MYYSANEVERTLKCSFCKEKFQDVIKFVPECGCFICDKCHADAKEAAVETGSYKCESCQETHSMPENGLADCKQLLPLLMCQPFEKPLSENARKLKTLINEIVDAIEKFEAFDGKEVVNEHCDRLEQDVKETVASAIERLSRVEADLLKEINEYRSQCQRVKDYKTKKHLETLSTKVKEFDAKWSCYFTRAECRASEADFDASVHHVKGFQTEMSTLEKQMRDEALGGRLLVFKPNMKFFDSSDILGKIVCISQRDVLIHETPTMTLTGHSSRIWAVIHLPDGKLASGSEDKTIRVWNIKEGKELFKLKGHTGYVYSLAILPNGLLASGSGDGTVKIWDLEERKEIRTLRGHTCSIDSICLLKNGNLASCSSDDSIKIWNPCLNLNNLLLTITGHGSFDWNLSIGVLSNGSLVSCSCVILDKEYAILRVWNPADGELINKFTTGIKAARSLVVLRSDRVAIGYKDGSIKIVDLTNDADSATEEQAHDSSIFALAQFSNGNLISYGEDSSKPTLKVWTTPDFDLLQTIETGHSKIGHSLSISSDEKCLASAGEKCSIKLWAIIN